MLKLSGKNVALWPLFYNDYYKKIYMVACAITGQVKRQAVHGKCVFDGGSAAVSPGFGLVCC